MPYKTPSLKLQTEFLFGENACDFINFPKITFRWNSII